MELPHRTLEQLLVEQGITQDDPRKVKRLQQERGERLERLLLDLGFISEEDLLVHLAAYLGVETVHRRDFPTAPVPLGNLNLEFLKHANVLPLAQTNGGPTVAMSDPADYYMIQSLQLATGLQVAPRLAREREVLEALETIYGGCVTAGRRPRRRPTRSSRSSATTRRTSTTSATSPPRRRSSAS